MGEKAYINKSLLLFMQDSTSSYKEYSRCTSYFWIFKFSSHHMRKSGVHKGFEPFALMRKMKFQYEDGEARDIWGKFCGIPGLILQMLFLTKKPSLNVTVEEA
jgi:hypothetical protein